MTLCSMIQPLLQCVPMMPTCRDDGGAHCVAARSTRHLADLAAQVAEARAQFPGLKVVAHPECTAEVAAVADFVGSTGAMMKYVKTTPAPYFLMLTECGLVGRLEVESPEKHFIGGCRLCPYMKLNSLEKIRDALRAPRPDQIVSLDEGLRLRAAKCIDRMFELTPGD